MKKTPNLHSLLLLVVSFVSFPASVFAQSASQQLITASGSIGDVVDAFTKNVVTALATLFATAAMAAFFFGLVQYIWGVREGVAKKIEDGNQFMIWGLVALFVMFSVWGIVLFGQKILGINGQNTIVIPSIQIGGSASTPSPSSPSPLPTGVSPTPSPMPTSSDCRTLADGTSCAYAPGRIGQCGTSEDGVRGCYVTPTGSTCGPNEIMTSTGCQPYSGVY